MDREDYVAALRRDGERLAEVAAEGMDRPVPSCPGWSVADLVWHTGEVHDFWQRSASGELKEFADHTPPERPPAEQLLAWYRDGLDRLVELLGGIDPSTPALTWSHQRDVGFIQRRMAQETAVHRWDAELAAGDPRPIEPALAVDGVDEFLEHMLPGRPANLEGPPQVVHLHATDADGEWVVRVGDGALHVDRAHAKGDAAARGTASDLLLLLWGRRRPADVEVHGDVAELERFVARTSAD